MGFSDARLAKLTGKREAMCALRAALGVRPASSASTLRRRVQGHHALHVLDL
jgi:hypothetical protein